MYRLLLFVLAASAWSQANSSAPAVRDAYVNAAGKITRTARLKSQLWVFVCKSEWDAYAQKGTDPHASLYLDDQLMADLDASRPKVFYPENTNQSDPKTAAAQDACAQRASSSQTPEAKALVGFHFYLNPTFADEDATTQAAIDAKRIWLLLLGRPWEKRDVGVSLGPPLGPPWPSVVRIGFERIDFAWLAAWAGLFLGAITLFIRFARTSDILRDSGPLPNATPGEIPIVRSYSLARTQMAVWTFLIAGALAFIFMVTWNQNIITSGVLGLMGVSFGTSLLASAADGTQGAAHPSKGFLRDLVSDGTAPSVHRYQMLLFTLILAAIFVVKTASGLVMPNFESTLLGLMGISSGTYVGFKFQGK